MKFSYIFTRAGRAALATALGLFIAAPAVSDAAVIVLKEDNSALDNSLGTANYGTGVAGGDFGAHTQFQGLTTASVTAVDVDDTRLIDNPAAFDVNLGGEASIGGSISTALLWKFDLSSVPGLAGGTVNAAVLRLYQTGGNGESDISTVTTHDWDEDLVTLASPIGTPGPGVGLGEWGPAANLAFIFGADAGGGSAFDIDKAIVGEGYTTYDVTGDVAAMAAGGNNYGWAGTPANNNYVSSENTALIGSAPALFLDYTPVPEPTSLLLAGVAAIGLAIRRRD